MNIHIRDLETVKSALQYLQKTMQVNTKCNEKAYQKHEAYLFIYVFRINFFETKTLDLFYFNVIVTFALKEPQPPVNTILYADPSSAFNYIVKDGI